MNKSLVWLIWTVRCCFKLIGYQATHASFSLFSENKLACFFTRWFVVRSSLTRWLHCIPHCSFTFIFAFPNRRLGGYVTEPNNTLPFKTSSKNSFFTNHILLSNEETTSCTSPTCISLNPPWKFGPKTSLINPLSPHEPTWRESPLLKTRRLKVLSSSKKYQVVGLKLAKMFYFEQYTLK